MTVEEFWELIGSVNAGASGDMDRKCTLLKEKLGLLESKEVQDFTTHFTNANKAAYTWPLWGAAYVMNGGCSDDSFSDFRATLISHGREIYENAMADPESLANVEYHDEESICYEGFQYVGFEVAEEKLGENFLQVAALPEDPAGEEWDEESVYERYPLLAKKYSGDLGNSEFEVRKKPWWKFW